MKTILAALAAMVCVVAPIGTATGLGASVDCPPILLPPFSGEDALDWMEQPDLNAHDLDRDGYSNLDEVLAWSDPTDTHSSPLDRDGDGVPALSDSCDTDPAQS